jgi:transducin (beta)-like 1
VIDGNVVPPGALITIVQKGLHYVELEANTDEVSTFIFYFLCGRCVVHHAVFLFQNDDEVEKNFALLEPLEIITKDAEELQQIVKKRKRERLHIERDKDKGKEKECIKEHEHHLPFEREREHHDKEKDQEREKDRTKRNRVQGKEKEREKQHIERIDKFKHEVDSLASGGN